MITGGCLCGAVRFKATEAPITARVCRCRDCQKIGAGGPTANAAFRTLTLTVEGALKDYVSIADSGNRMHRKFCPSCGTHLLSEAESRPHLVFVRLGALDDPEAMKPVATIWTASAPSWACIDHALPQMPRQPPPAA
jgi:hypothetical protein